MAYHIPFERRSIWEFSEIAFPSILLTEFGCISCLILVVVAAAAKRELDRHGADAEKRSTAEPAEPADALRRSAGEDGVQSQNKQGGGQHLGAF